MIPFPVIPPFVLGGRELIKKVALSGNNTMVLTTKGNLYVTGRNRIGELGVGDANPRYNQWVLVMQNVNHIGSMRETLFAVSNSGTVYSPDTRVGSATIYTWQAVETWSAAGDLSADNIKELISDTENIFVWKKDNSLYYLGNNSGGQANTGNTNAVGQMRLHTSDVQKLSISGNTVVVMKSDGFLYGCGDNTRNILSATSGNILTLTQMFGTNADGGAISDFSVTAAGSALLVRYTNGIYRTKGLNIGQLPTGTANPGATLTNVPSGYTPGDGSEPMIHHLGLIRNSGTYPAYSSNLFYYTGNTLYACGAATGFMTGVNQSSGTVSPWTQMDASGVKIEGLKGMSFGEGWLVAYNDRQIMYWGNNGSTEIKPIVGYLSSGRQSYQSMFATSPLEA